MRRDIDWLPDDCSRASASALLYIMYIIGALRHGLRCEPSGPSAPGNEFPMTDWDIVTGVGITALGTIRTMEDS